MSTDARPRLARYLDAMKERYGMRPRRLTEYRKVAR